MAVAAAEAAAEVTAMVSSSSPAALTSPVLVFPLLLQLLPPPFPTAGKKGCLSLSELRPIKHRLAQSAFRETVIPKP